LRLTHQFRQDQPDNWEVDSIVSIPRPTSFLLTSLVAQTLLGETFSCCYQPRPWLFSATPVAQSPFVFTRARTTHLHRHVFVTFSPCPSNFVVTIRCHHNGRTGWSNSPLSRPFDYRRGSAVGPFANKIRQYLSQSFLNCSISKQHRAASFTSIVSV
jgi:hypothetical protein